jgi:phosphoribosylamine--glycine ligase
MSSGGYPAEYEKGKQITGIKAAAEDLLVFQAGTAIKDNELVTAGGRVLAVTALGATFDEVIKRAYQGVEKINFAGAQMRTDIGQKALTKQ